MDFNLKDQFETIQDFADNDQKKDLKILQLLVEKSIMVRDHAIAIKDKEKYELQLKIANRELLIASRCLFARHIYERVVAKLLEEQRNITMTSINHFAPHETRWKEIFKVPETYSNGGCNIRKLYDLLTHAKINYNNEFDIQKIANTAQGLAKKLNNGCHNSFVPGRTTVRLDKNILSKEEIELMIIICKLYPLNDTDYQVVESEM